MTGESSVASKRGGDKKVTRAFKISKNLDDALVSLADKQGITPSSFVNRLLVQYFDWWQHDTTGSVFLTLDRRIFMALIEDVSEEKNMDIARSIALVATRDFLKFRYGKLDSEAVFSFLDMLTNYMNWGRINTIERENREIEVLVKHDLGIKWSIFVSEFISSLLSSYLGMETISEFSTFGCSVTASPQQKPAGRT